MVGFSENLSYDVFTNPEGSKTGKCMFAHDSYMKDAGKVCRDKTGSSGWMLPVFYHMNCGGKMDQYTKRKNFIINIVYAILVLAIAYIILKYAVTLVMPFILAFLVAYLIRKPARAISKKLKIPVKPVSFILVLLFYCIAGVLITFLGVKIVTSISRLIMEMPNVYSNQIEPFLLNAFNSMEKAIYHIDPALVKTVNDTLDQFVGSLGTNISKISMGIVSSLSGIAASFPAFLIKILLMIISTFFIAMDFDMLASFLLRQFSGKSRELLLTVKQYIVNTLFVVIRSYALIMSITFVELSIGLTIIGIPNSVLIALGIAVFDILPVLGTGGIMIPWAIITLIQGDLQKAAGLVIVYVIVTIIRNILEPKIVGSQLGLHPVITLMSMYVGASLIGVVGLFGFPITLSLLKNLSDRGVIKIFK